MDNKITISISIFSQRNEDGTTSVQNREFEFKGTFEEAKDFVAKTLEERKKVQTPVVATDSIPF